MNRIEKLCSHLSPCQTFADVGCDHGYCTQYMLKNDLCKTAIITDISAKSLQKAQNLLSGFIEEGRCKAVCCDGLSGVDVNVDQVLIAGMGGEEIIKILTNSFIPKSFVFQPMKNPARLRRFLLDNGCKITYDDIFWDGKFYFIIKGENCGGTLPYTQAELEFGRNSLTNPVLVNFLDEEIAKNYNYLSAPMTEGNKRIIEGRIKFLQGVKKGEIK
jgi:tRNA (adenine22-N1)-methyltransferase